MKIQLRNKKPNTSSSNSIFLQFYLIPLIIFVAAFLLRVLWIGTYAGQDEVYYVGYASDILHGKSFANVFPPLFEFIVLPILAFTSENLVVVHIFMAVLGALTVLFVYLIGRKFFNVWIGIIGSLLLMFNTTHWFFSAFGMLDVPATLFATSAIYFLWSGYTEKNDRLLFIGAILNVFAVFVRYTVFPSIALFGYWLLFDRSAFRNKKNLVVILLPLIAWGLWMIYFITQVGWLWNWWLQYVTGQLSINIPWYNYFQAVHYEYLGPILTYFTIFTSLFLLTARHTKINKTALAALFLLLFIGTVYFYNNFSFDPLTQAAIGFAALALPAIYFFNISDIGKIFGKPLQNPDFNKFLIFLIAAVFLFYSPLGVKFPRYVMSALPAIYLLVGAMVMETKSFKFTSVSKFAKYLFIAAAIFVLATFAFANAQDTINKLVVDKTINDVKYTAQKYINDNSPQCSKIYSATWYGFYYLRNRITDLPSDAASLKSTVKANCNCPPQFFIVEGAFDQKFAGIATLNSTFQHDSVNYHLTWSGITTPAPIAPVDVYKINGNVINQQCPS